MKHIMKRGMGKEQGSSSVENIIKDNKNSVKNLIVNHHTNLGGGGGKNPPVSYAREEPRWQREKKRVKPKAG